MLELPPKVDFWLPPKPAIIRPAPDIKRASFMPGMFPAGAIAAGAVAPLPKLAFLQATEDASNLTTYSFASQNIGAADATRRVVVVCCWRASGTIETFNSATIGGAAATIHVNQNGASAVSGGAAIISLLVPTGTTATIAFTLSNAGEGAAIGVYRAVNETVATPHATAADGGGTSGLFTTTINIPANGWVVAGSNNSGSSGRSMTWTGATEDFDAPYSDGAGVVRTGAHQEALALQTGRTISVQSSDSATTAGALVAMSWG